MDRFDALCAFVAVADAGSFVRAAAVLGQSPVKVSRLVAGLEEHLGVSLFLRTTRHVAITHEGSALLDRARTLLADLHDAEQLAIGSTSEPQGEIHVTAPVMFGRLHVLPVVTHLLQRHARLSIRMMLVDRTVRIVEEGIDVAVRIGHPVDSGLMTVRLGSVRQTLVASPQYLARRGVPDSLSELAGHECLGGSGIHAHGWRLGESGRQRVETTPRLSVNDVASTIAAAEAGAGIANVLSYQVKDQLRTGALRTILDAAMPEPLPVQLLYARNRSTSPAVRSFIDAMKARAAREDWRHDNEAGAAHPPA